MMRFHALLHGRNRLAADHPRVDARAALVGQHVVRLRPGKARQGAGGAHQGVELAAARLADQVQRRPEAPEVGKDQLIDEAGLPAHQVETAPAPERSSQRAWDAGPAGPARGPARPRSGARAERWHGRPCPRRSGPGRRCPFPRCRSARRDWSTPGNTFSTIAPPSSSTKAGRTPRRSSSATMAGASPPMHSSSPPKAK